MSDERSNMNYETQLSDLGQTHPLLAGNLMDAAERRQGNLAKYHGGARFRGLEELLRHVQFLENEIESATKGPKIGFLYRRARADFETAIEATLSGYSTVAFDMMRDVMEIEFLIREFAADLSTADAWLAANPKQLGKDFRPSVLRERHAKRVGKPVDQLRETLDYKGHSVALHVMPVELPLAQKGRIDENVGFGIDMCFWEVFEHGRRLFWATYEMLQNPVFTGINNPNPDLDLPAFKDAWQRTQEMQDIFRALLSASTAHQDDENT